MAHPSSSADLEAQETLWSFLSSFDALNTEEVEALAPLIPVKRFKKGTVLLKADEVSRECYFVLKGCLRQYHLVNGVEKTTQFFTEEEAAVIFSSFVNQTPSGSYLSCVEESILIVGEMGADAYLYEQFPKLELITRKMMEQHLGKSQDALAHFISSSPEERYLHLLSTKPGLMQRVPQHQLASYLGVTPESLSRIRKRLLKAH